MKKYLLFTLTAILITGITAHTQTSTGVINYESKINLHRNLTGEREAMKAMVPEFRTVNYQLVFDGSASLYKPVLEDEPDPSSTGTVRIMRQAYSESYTDILTRTKIRLQELMGKTYIINDSLTIEPWKMGDETREINGYTCRMAYYTDTTNAEVTAWFTMDLPAFTGPAGYNTLPGTVLAVDINNGEREIVAKDIIFRELKKNELKKPEKGIAITAADYRKLQEEQMERMRQNGGRMIIRN